MTPRCCDCCTNQCVLNSALVKGEGNVTLESSTPRVLSPSTNHAEEAMPWKRRQKFLSATAARPTHAMMFPMNSEFPDAHLSYTMWHNLETPLSHGLAISTIVTAANAKKRLPPTYAIIFSDRNVPSKEPPRTAINVATP